MKPFSPDIFLRSRLCWAAAAGLLLAAAFPPFNVAGFAWIAPALLLFSAANQPPRRRFSLGYAAGVAYYLASLHWILFIPVPLGAVAGWLALCFFLALYPAAWVGLCWRIFPGDPQAAPSQAGWVEAFLSVSWGKRALWAAGCAAIWVALEMVLARMLGGFPWNLAGVSQVKILPLIQIASVTGVYGVSFLVVWLSVALGCAAVVLFHKPMDRRRLWGELVLPAAAVGMAAAWGWGEIEPPRETGRSIRMALVQPSIPQTMIWDPSENSHRFEKLIALSREALAGKPDVLVWPEAALPGMDAASYQVIAHLAASSGAWMILGADDVEWDGGEAKYFNSSILLDPQGRLIDHYRKRRLVMFGEYVPFRKWLPFMSFLSPVGVDFTPGDGPAIFPIGEPEARISPIICFEDVFPHHGRDHAGPEADILLTLTNNGWFRESAAHWQHAHNSVFRTIENRLPLVRSANNGITCWIDEFGRFRSVFGQGDGNVYAEGYLMVEVPLGMQRARTFYNRHGDWFGWSCVAISTVLLVTVLARRRGVSGGPAGKRNLTGASATAS